MISSMAPNSRPFFYPKGLLILHGYPVDFNATLVILKLLCNISIKLSIIKSCLQEKKSVCDKL